MMKSTEWGAVAYLASSAYGKHNEVWINPNSGYLTGCAGASVNAGGTTGCNQYQTANGQQASTTGNVYGIYDMAGGAREYVMGYNKGVLGHSGFTNLPNLKYYNEYTSGITHNDQTAYNRRILGDATGETRGWNNDYANFVTSTNSWSHYGGLYSDTQVAGIFAFSYSTAGTNAGHSFRTVILGGQPLVDISPNGNDWSTNPQIKLTVTSLNSVDLNSLRYEWTTELTEPTSITNLFSNNAIINIPNETGLHHLWIQYTESDGITYKFKSQPFRNGTASARYMPDGNGILQQLYKSHNSTQNTTLQVNGEEYAAEVYYFSDNVRYGSNPTLCDAEPDTKMCVLIYEKNLIVDPGVTLTPQVRKRGFTVIVKGILENSGIISMTARGASAVGQNVYLFENSNNQFEFVPALGGVGGTATSVSAGSSINGRVGAAGADRSTGGGGSGAANYGGGGAGGRGTSYSGGTGGGGGGYDSKKGTAGSSTGGAGGNGAPSRTSASGGTGNPGGGR